MVNWSVALSATFSLNESKPLSLNKSLSARSHVERHMSWASVLSMHPALSAWPFYLVVHVHSTQVLHWVHKIVLIDQSVGETYKKKENICFLTHKEKSRSRGTKKQRKAKKPVKGKFISRTLTNLFQSISLSSHFYICKSLITMRG